MHTHLTAPASIIGFRFGRGKLNLHNTVKLFSIQMRNGIPSVSINWIRSKLWMPLVLNAFNRIFLRWSPVFEHSCWHAKCKTLWVIDKTQKRLPTECCWVLQWSSWWDHLSSQLHFQLGWQSRGLHNNPAIAMSDTHSRDLKRLQTKPTKGNR